MRDDVCKYYRPSMIEDACEKGHKLEDKIVDFKSGPIWNRIPCWDRSGLTCEDKENYTREEVEAFEKECDELIEASEKCKKAILSYIRENGYNIRQDLQDWIVCPLCGSQLYFFYAGYNGHVHAKCDQDGCIEFQE